MRLFEGPKLVYVVLGTGFLLVLGSSISTHLRPLYFVQVGATSLELGLIMALPFLVSIIIRAPISALSNRLGKRRLILFSILVSLATNTLFAFVYDPIWFYPIVSLSAVSWPMFSLVAIMIVSDRSTSTTRGATMGMFFTAIGAALLCGPLLSSLFTLFIDLRHLFFISLAPPLLALIFFLLTTNPRDMEEQLVDEPDMAVDDGSWRGITRIFRIKNAITLYYARITFSLSYGVFSTLFPVYAGRTLGLSPSLIALLFTFRGVTNVLVRMPAGRLSDRIGRKKPLLLGYGITLAVFALLAFTENFTSLAIVMALYGVGWGMRIAPSTALLSESVKSEDRPLALAMLMTMFDVGSLIGALLAGATSVLLSTPTLLLLCAPILFSTLVVLPLFSKETDAISVK